MGLWRPFDAIGGAAGLTAKDNLWLRLFLMGVFKATRSVYVIDTIATSGTLSVGLGLLMTSRLSEIGKHYLLSPFQYNDAVAGTVTSLSIGESPGSCPTVCRPAAHRWQFLTSIKRPGMPRNTLGSCTRFGRAPHGACIPTCARSYSNTALQTRLAV